MGQGVSLLNINLKHAMKTDYTEFQLILGNGEKCTVRYCDAWGSPLFGSRTIHFEFRDNLTISHTGYRSEFRIIGEKEKVEPEAAAKIIIEQITGIKFTGVNVQQKLL
jgi:hypothetical protein